MLKRLPRSEVQLRLVEQGRAQLSLAEAAANTLTENAKEAESILREIQELEDRIAPYSDIPRPQKQRTVTESLESKLQTLKQERKHLDGIVARSGARLQCLLLELEAFENTYHLPPDEMLSSCAEYNARLQRSKEETRRREQIAAEKRGALEATLRRSVAALREFGLLKKTGQPAISQSAEEMLSMLQEGDDKAKAEVGSHTLEALCQDRDQFNERLRQIAAEIESINEQLKRAEEVVISEASVIATTLTQAYLRDTYSETAISNGRLR